MTEEDDEQPMSSLSPAAPEPAAGPTEDDIDELCDVFNCDSYARPAIRRALELWGHQPTPEPAGSQFEVVENVLTGGQPMSSLSPAATAIWEAFNEDEAGVFVDYGDKMAAALRALADQVLPEEPEPKLFAMPLSDWNLKIEGWDARMAVRSKILSIATELEGG